MFLCNKKTNKMLFYGENERKCSMNKSQSLERAYGGTISFSFFASLLRLLFFFGRDQTLLRLFTFFSIFEQKNFRKSFCLDLESVDFRLWFDKIWILSKKIGSKSESNLNFSLQISEFQSNNSLTIPISPNTNHRLTNEFPESQQTSNFKLLFNISPTLNVD